MSQGEGAGPVLLDSDDDYKTVTIKVKIPKGGAEHRRVSSSDAMLLGLADDSREFRGTLLVNGDRVFWKDGARPETAALEQTRERSEIMRKVTAERYSGA